VYTGGCDGQPADVPVFGDARNLSLALLAGTLTVAVLAAYKSAKAMPVTE
jgi:hypothetical protein